MSKPPVRFVEGKNERQRASADAKWTRWAIAALAVSLALCWISTGERAEAIFWTWWRG